MSIFLSWQGVPMADIKKNERVVQLLVVLLKYPKRAFSVKDLMTALGLPEAERRNLQRDMNLLMDLPDRLVVCEGRGPCKKYRTGLNVLDKLTLPDFENVMLQFVFLQNIANIYPGTADLIEDLVDKIQRNLPRSEQEKLKGAYKDIHSRVFFVGGFRPIDDKAGEKLHTLLQAIRTHHEIKTNYTASNGSVSEKNRIPVGIALYQGEIYIACVQHNKPESVYPIKLSRINAVELTDVTFDEHPETRSTLEKTVKDFSLFNEQENCVERVLLTFPSEKRAFVEEYPYHQSMQVKERKGLLHVTMDVNVTRQLKQWLLFHTENGVEVLKPKHLRDDLRRIGLGIAEKYKK